MDKLREILGFLISLAVIVFAAYYSGILKGFSPDDFKDAGNEIVNIVTKQTSGSEKYLTTQKTSGNQSIAAYKNYKPNPIPRNVLEGSNTTGTWRNVFNADKKVIFYIYDETDKKYSYDFHKAVSNLYMGGDYARNYILQPYSYQAFISMRQGEIGPTKICDSIEECDAIRRKAANYSLLTNFLDSCGKTMCVFKPSEKQYIRIRKRNFEEAKQAINTLKNW